MALDVTVATTLHLVFAALWTGAVVFFTWAVLRPALAGDIDAAPLGAITGRLQWVSRVSAAVLLLTGGHVAQAGYTVDTLTGTTRGQLVLLMVLLWAALAALVEIAGARLRSGTDELKVRDPARSAKPFLVGASVVAVALLLVAGLLASP